MQNNFGYSLRYKEVFVLRLLKSFEKITAHFYKRASAECASNIIYLHSSINETLCKCYR